MRKTELIRSLVILLVISLCLPLIACDFSGSESTAAPETTAPEVTKAPDAEQTRVLSTMKTEESETKAPDPEKPEDNKNPGNNSADAKYKAVGHIVVYAEGYMVFDSRNYGPHSYSSNTTKPTPVAFLNSYCRKNGDLLDCDVYGSTIDSITVKNEYGTAEFAASENTYWDCYILEDSSMSVLDDRMVYTVVFNLRTRSGATETTRRPETTKPATTRAPETTPEPTPGPTEAPETPETIPYEYEDYPLSYVYDYSQGGYYVDYCADAYSGVSINSSIYGISVYAIDSFAFSNCYSLEYLYIPSSVTFIANNAFNDCLNLSYIDYNGYGYQWENAIAKSHYWNAWTANITVSCWDAIYYYSAEYAPAETPEETPEETEPDETEPDETEPVETDPIDLESWLPEQIDLGIDMTVLAGILYYDEWLEEDNGELVGTELYNRVRRVEDRLGINLKIEMIKGTGADRAPYMEEVAKRQESTDPNLLTDAVSGYSQFIGELTLEGRFQNFAWSDNINFENPWWPADLIENSVIDDKIYFVSGDISPSILYETYAIFYNRDLVAKYNIEDPIDLVINYEWTIDKLISITSEIYEDLDKATSGPSKGDFYAFNINDAAHYKALPFAMGIRVIVPDEDEGYVYSDLYTGEKMDVIHDKVSDWLLNNNGVHAPSEGFNDYCTGFANGTIIFNLGNLANGSFYYYAGTGVGYGVVPCPMYDEAQEAYYSYYGNPTSFWAIPTNVDLDNAALLVEYLAADAYVYISPALFERVFKIKYVVGEVDGLSRIFDIIRDGLLFDPCMFYNNAIGNSAYNGFSALGTDMASWSGTFTRVQLKSMERTLKNNVVAKLRALEY